MPKYNRGFLLKNLDFLHFYGFINLIFYVFIEFHEVLSYLSSRTKLLDAVTISGGEPTLQKDLKDFIVKVKNLGYKIKLDTNGSSPFIVKTLLEKNLIDYIALDFKCPDYKQDVFMKAHKYWYNFTETFKIIQESGIPFETRTTVHTDVIDEDDINAILKTLEEWGYKGTHYIQFFFPADETLGNVKSEMRRFDIDKIKSSIPVEYRNIEGNPVV